MKEICVKKIACCGCPNMDTCTLEKSENLLKELFTRYGSYTKEMSEKTIRIYEQHPEKLHTEKDVLQYFDKAQKDIEQLERVILQLKAYENALTERYNFIKTAPTKQKNKAIPGKEMERQSLLLYSFLFRKFDRRARRINKVDQIRREGSPESYRRF